MRVELFRRSLATYRPSLMIKIHCQGQHHFDISVAEMLCNLSAMPDSDQVALFGSHDFIIKEKVRGFNSLAERQGRLALEDVGPLADEWLEIDTGG